MINRNCNRWATGLFCLLSIALAGCSKPNETWHCYDREGRPAAGVLIICQYGLADHDEEARSFRFTDQDGKAILSRDSDTPDELPGDIACVYSRKLCSGSIMAGRRWHEGQPIPVDVVYFDEWENKIYIKNGVDDSVVWHSALNALIYQYSLGTGLLYGGKTLKSGLSYFVHSERALFLEKYGAEKIPEDYLQKLRQQASWDDERFKNNRRPNFYEVTLPITEQ